ncbi:Membrane-bound transcription factor site-2 protease homolog-like [Zea mays]|uniref:Endopeptidase S2P n=2 Tax=Zea mays TaxID=4577 RepID=B4FN90_MAIZE|nr:Membrane-bound transcription factor site-2 protease homolog-like [Zea mays]ACF83583.1 unknown [Zea mays]|eukprot:NP_001140322.1 uncharacterized protein LOC100272369 [Zea mays]
MISAGRSRRRGRAPASLPTTTTAASRRTEHSISCCYCDCKIYSLNDALFNLGWKYARYMRAWFSVGVYLSLIALVSISLMLLWESIGVFYFRSGFLSAWLQNLLTSGLNISIVDTTIIIMSTILSIVFHEFGHAIAAARTDDWIKILNQGTTAKSRDPEFLEGSHRYVATSSTKGYCVPDSWIDASKNLWQIRDKLPCPDELIAFEKVICNVSTILTEKTSIGSDQKEVEGKYCLIAKDVVKLRRCGNGWHMTEDDESSCACFEDEHCLVPVLNPGFSWIEVSYARPYSLRCLQKGGNLLSSHTANSNFGQSPCEGSFVYVGDLSSAARSVRLSRYRPRWALLLFIADIPYILENGLSSLLHASAALAVINCLPVYFLDGEAILETTLSYVAWFTPRLQRRILKVCSVVWTGLLVITFSSICYSTVLHYGV